MPGRPAPYLQFPVAATFPHPDTEATVTVSLGRSHPTRKTRVASLAYLNPTTVVLDASNYYTIVFKAGAVTIGTKSLTGGITGAAWNAMTLSATDADLVIPANTALTAVITKTASAPALDGGLIQMHGALV